MRACVYVGLRAHVFVYECVQFAHLYIFGCVHAYMCVCVLSHRRWSIAITGSLDTCMTFFVGVDGPLNQVWQTVAVRGDPVMPQMILYISLLHAINDGYLHVSGLLPVD